MFCFFLKPLLTVNVGTVGCPPLDMNRHKVLPGRTTETELLTWPTVAMLPTEGDPLAISFGCLTDYS
jgi:hypothetical protein